jgi:hypothetical protein
MFPRLFSVMNALYDALCVKRAVTEILFSNNQFSRHMISV